MEKETFNLGEDEGDMNPYADDFEKYGLYGQEDEGLMLGEDGGNMNPFADDFEKFGLYGNETHPTVQAGQPTKDLDPMEEETFNLGEDEGDMNPYADDFEKYGLYGKEDEPEDELMFGQDGHDEMNPFADDFDKYGIYGPDNVQCPAGKVECNFAPGKSECCKDGEYCIPNVGCRCEAPDDGSDDKPVDISNMYIV